MEINSVIICMGGQKGGTGKSLLSTLLASYINDKTKYSVQLIDADDKQLSIETKRQSEIEDGLTKENLHDINVYASIEAGAKIHQNDYGVYDFIIVDFPGTLGQKGVTAAYTVIDLIFIPLNIISESEVNSTIGFCELLEETVDVKRKEQDIEESEKYFVSNKVRKSLKEYKNSALLDELKEGAPYDFLDNRLPLWTLFEREWQTHTYPQLDNPKKQREIDAVFDEMFGKAETLYKKFNQ